jgi:hypothetical protein
MYYIRPKTLYNYYSNTTYSSNKFPIKLDFDSNENLVSKPVFYNYGGKPPHRPPNILLFIGIAIYFIFTKRR